MENVHRESVTVHQAPPRGIEIRLEDTVPGAPRSVRPVAVAEHVRRLHPAARRFRDERDRHEVSSAALGRAVRIVHALATEAERRGYAVSNAAETPDAYGRRSWSAANDGHLVISVDGDEHPLRIKEEGLPSRADWEWRRLLQEASGPWRVTRQRDTGGDARYAEHATGRLLIILDGGYSREGRASKWADRSRWTLESKLPEVLWEIEVRAAEAAHRRLLKEHDDADRRRRWETAMQAARVRYLDDYLAARLLEQVHAWQNARAIRAYCEALETAVAGMSSAEGGVVEWIAWARAHADRIDPLHNPPSMPVAPEISSEALKPYLGGWNPYGP